MPRVIHSVASKKRKKRVLKRAKGFFAQKHKRFGQAKRAVIKALVYQYRDRKVRKGEFKRLWIVRLNAACREAGLSYSRFIKGLKTAKVEINRKVLADLAINAPDAFNKLVDVAKANGEK